MLGADKALQFYAGYVVELSLSVDNLFVFLLLFKFFQVRFVEEPSQTSHSSSQRMSDRNVLSHSRLRKLVRKFSELATREGKDRQESAVQQTWRRRQ